MSKEKQYEDALLDQQGFPRSIEFRLATESIEIDRDDLRKAMEKVARDEKKLLWTKMGLRLHPNFVAMIVTSWLAEANNLARQKGPAKPRLVVPR